MPRDTTPRDERDPNRRHPERVSREEEGLALDERERLAAVREVFVLFMKAVRGHRLYMSRGANVEKLEEQLREALAHQLDERTRLTVEVTPHELLLDGRPVLNTAADESEELIYELFRDGLRTLTFHAGIDREELHRLLGVMVADLGQPEYHDEDRVTLLWSSRLPHVDHTEVETFSDGAMFLHRPDYREHFLARVNGLLGHAARALTPATDLPHPAAVTSGEDLESIDEDPLLAGFHGFAGGNALADLQGPQAIRVLEGVEADSQATPLRVVEMLMALLEHEGARFDARGGSEILERAMEDRLVAGDYAGLAVMCATLRLYRELEDGHRNRRAVFTDHVLTRLSRYNRVILLRDGLQGGDTRVLQEVLAFVALIPTAALDGVVHLLGKLREGPGYRALRDHLEARAADLTPFWQGRLASAPTVAQIEAVRRLAASGNPQALQTLRQTLGHENPTLRREALLALRGTWDEELAGRIAEYLAGSEAGPRLAALEFAMAARAPEMFEPLQALLEQADFARREAGEQALSVAALVRSDPERGLAWAHERLSSRGLFGGRRTRALQVAVGVGLARCGLPDALELALAWVAEQPEDDPARVAVEEALTEVGRGGGHA